MAMKNCCKPNCCDVKFEMRAGERQRFFIDLCEFLASIGTSGVDCINWEAETPHGASDLAFEEGPFNPMNRMASVIIEGGTQGATYEVNAFIQTCDGQRAQRCFQLYIQEC